MSPDSVRLLSQGCRGRALGCWRFRTGDEQSLTVEFLPEGPPQVGELVQVRSRRWIVEEVARSDNPRESALVRLACVDDDNQGQSLDVFWEYEPDRQIIEDAGWDSLAGKGLDPPEQFAAFLNTLRWNCTTATDPTLFQAPFRAGITIEAYQMEPLRKALLLPRVNLLIADDTGLGKTIEAGLITRELLLRRKVKVIVVAAPPSMLEQWKGELEDRFGLVFEVLDRRYVSRMRRERGFGVNPWRTHSRFLISHRLLIDPQDRIHKERRSASRRNNLGDDRLPEASGGGCGFAWWCAAPVWLPESRNPGRLPKQGRFRGFRALL